MLDRNQTPDFRLQTEEEEILEDRRQFKGMFNFPQLIVCADGASREEDWGDLSHKDKKNLSLTSSPKYISFY